MRGTNEVTESSYILSLSLRIALEDKRYQMSETPPFLNANQPEKWDADREISLSMIIRWLAEEASTGERRIALQELVSSSLDLLASSTDLSVTITGHPEILRILRALTRRDIGTSQIATFTGVSTVSYESMEAGRTSIAHMANRIVDLILTELDEGLAQWVLDSRAPTEEERKVALIVATDRILRRSTSTELRYKHEPRQLERLKEFLLPLGYVEVQGSTIRNPRSDMSPGTFAFRVSIEGTTEDEVILKQSVDVLVMPFSSIPGKLPIFIEAKSMTDTVNPNKRQKEEAQKASSVRRRWEGENEKLNFILVIAGTVPRRYLQVEAGSGLDWVWEHRVEDLQLLLEWYARN